MMRSRVNPFTFEGAVRILRRNAFSMLITMSVSIILALIFYYRTPRIYFSSTTVLIPSSYFKLILDDPPTSESELGAYRLAYVREAFTDDFLDRVGEKFGLFEHPLDDPDHGPERQELRSRFKVQLSSPSTVNIDFTSDSAQQSAAALGDFIKYLRKNLGERIPDGVPVSEEIVAEILPPHIPDEPLYPKRRDYAQAGFAVGLLIALAQLLYREYRHSRYLYPEEVATAIGGEYFGELPEVPRLEWLYLIDQVKGVQQRLISQ